MSQEDLMHLIGLDQTDDLAEIQQNIELLQASGLLSKKDASLMLLHLIERETITAMAERQALIKMSLTLGRPS